MPVQVINKIESLCAYFIWNNKCYDVSWTQLCRPKEYGGVGLKDFKCLQKALAIKMIWVFLQNNSIRARWMRSKYAKEKNFWTMTLDNNASYTWKTMIKAREDYKNFITKKIVNGQDTYLFFDLWINGRNLISYVGWHHLTWFEKSDLKVASIIQDGNWKLEGLYLPPLQIEEHLYPKEI